MTLDFTNPQPLTHDVAIEDSSGKTIGKTELIAEGSDSATVDLKPGTTPTTAPSPATAKPAWKAR